MTKRPVPPPTPGFRAWLESNPEAAELLTEIKLPGNLAADLRQFTGTEHYYRHNLARGVTYTDGVKYLAEKAGAYWLVDKIAINQLDPKIKRMEFQSWKLDVSHNNTAVLTCDDGNYKIVHREDITFTDFPMPDVELWVEQGVILLPSEH